MNLSRGVLGTALVALTTLIGGAAAYGLWGEISYMFFDGAPLPAEARAIAYGAFWLAQTIIAGGKSAGAKVLFLGRAAALVVGAYFFWSWNAGDASTVWEATMATMPALNTPGALVPDFPKEFWRHALMTTGVWMTLGTVLPDYAQRMSSAGRVAKGQIAWLPVLTACAALVASSMAQAPNLALYSVVAVAALVTNTVANFVGPMAAIGGVKPGMGSAVAVSVLIACAAPLVMTWQQTVAVASWAVGIGSSLVAPVAGVMLADYWIMRGRVVDRSQLSSDTGPGGAYHYLGGVNMRAVLAFLVGVAPDLISVARGASTIFGGSASATAMGAESFLSAYVVNMEYASMIGFGASFVAYILLSVLFTPDSLKIARAEARRMKEEDDELARELAAAKADPYVDGPASAKYANAVAASTSSVPTSASSSSSKPGRPSGSSVEAGAPSPSRRRRRRRSPPRSPSRSPRNKARRFSSRSPRRPRTSSSSTLSASATVARSRRIPTAMTSTTTPSSSFIAPRPKLGIERSLLPAMASRADAQNNLRALAKERQIMLEGHVENRDVMSMVEVRYEVMQMNLLIAEAELAAAEIERDLAEARAFFEGELEEDVSDIEERLARDPPRPSSAIRGRRPGGLVGAPRPRRHRPKRRDGRVWIGEGRERLGEKRERGGG